MAFDPDDYVRKILAARRIHLALDARAMARLEEILEAHAGEIRRQLAQLPADASLAEQRAIAERITRELHDRLSDQLQRATERGIRVQYTTIKQELDSVTVQAIRDASVSVAGVFQPRPSAQSAAAYLARGSTAETFRTLDSAVQGAAAGVDDLVSEALTAGWSPEKLARKIRPFIMGRSAFTAEELEDLRRVPSSRRNAVKQLMFNTRRIAITEMGNAVHEAQIENMVEAPMVEAWRWRLSPVRGTQQDKPDVCDILAKLNVYDLGDGIFPVKKVPRRPHPFDRCWGQSITRQVGEWEKAKPDPQIVRLPTLQNTQAFFNPDQTSTHIERQVLLGRRVIREASQNAVAA